MAHKLPNGVIDDLGTLLPALRELGYSPIASQHSPWSFGGDYFVDFTGPGGHGVRVLYDRSQYTVEAERAELEAAGLWKAFNERPEFERSLLAWLQERKSDKAPTP
jgi:hypothetical protein